MSNILGGIFSPSDNLAMISLDQRLKRSAVINSNIANSETPGYRALGYQFENQLQDLFSINSGSSLKVASPSSLKASTRNADGSFRPEVYIRPQEAVGNDGNTVDVDEEMARLAQNQILYRSAVELINRKVGTIRYGINGGR